MTIASGKHPFASLCVMALSAAVSIACAQTPDPKPDTPRAPATAVNADAAAKFKAAGRAAGLTVLPTRLGPGPVPQVGEVVAIMLERAGMTDLETSSQAFTPPENAGEAETAKALGEFVKANPPATAYVLYTEFMGSPQAGVAEVRSFVVNKQGDVAWQDRQVKGDADFDRIKPREPLQCCILVAERLRPVLGLGNPNDENAPTGKIAQRWQKNTGLPDKAETAAIEQRGEAFKKSAANATLLIYPAHAGDSFSPESAKSISAALVGAKLTKATAAENGPKLETTPNMNEQKVLWAMAHAFSEQVKKNPPETDYVMFADYLMGKNAVGGVHFAICNKSGELVVVDFQNNHWPDFKEIDPKTREDCDRLVIKRMERFCK